MRWYNRAFGVSAFLLQRINQPIGPKGIPSAVSTDLINLPYYTLRSVFRMMLALIASLIFTIIYGSLAAQPPTRQGSYPAARHFAIRSNSWLPFGYSNDLAGDFPRIDDGR